MPFGKLLRNEGLEIFEPVGQDGRRCQYLAFADQAERNGCWKPGTHDAEYVEVESLAQKAQRRLEPARRTRRNCRNYRAP